MASTKKTHFKKEDTTGHYARHRKWNLPSVINILYLCVTHDCRCKSNIKHKLTITNHECNMWHPVKACTPCVLSGCCVDELICGVASFLWPTLFLESITLVPHFAHYNNIHYTDGFLVLNFTFKKSKRLNFIHTDIQMQDVHNFICMK